MTMTTTRIYIPPRGRREAIGFTLEVGRFALFAASAAGTFAFFTIFGSGIAAFGELVGTVTGLR